MNLTKNEEQLKNQMLAKVSLAKDKKAMESNIVNLSKTVVRLSKEKNFDLTGLTSQVVIVLDHSGSMNMDYRSGNVQKAVTKLVPLGLNFDDNGEIEAYRFDSNAKQIEPSLSIENYENYVDNYVYNSRDMGGTYYAKPLQLIYRDYCGGVIDAVKPGFFSKLLGKGTNPVATQPKNDTPVYVIFITDGENADERATTEILQKLIQNNVFVQFVGVGNEDFRYLKQVDNELLGVSFVKFDDIKSMDSDGVYEKILSEFTEWLANKH